MSEKTYTVRKALTAKEIADLVTTAVEGGISYWAQGFKPISNEHAFTERPWYACPKLYSGDFVIRVTELEESTANAGVDHDLTPEKMQTALDHLAEKYPHVMADIVNENYDAGDADCFIQAAIFGSIVYG